MESSGNRKLIRRTSDSSILDLFQTTEEIEPILRDAASEILLKDVPMKITFLDVENDSMGDHLDVFDSPSNEATSEEEYPVEYDDFEKNMEQYVIVSKYGLPSKTRCTCHFENSIPSSRSCTDLLEIKASDIALSRAKSCFEFTKNSEDLDSICMKHVNNLGTLRQYNEACQTYEMFLKSAINSEEFDDVEYSFQLQYPHLWSHLADYYNIYPDYDLVSKENESMLKIIHSCKCMLKEEEIYRMRNINLFRNRMNFSGKMKDLQADFEIAGNYLKKEYPFLFTILTWKNKLSKFVTQRMVIEKNRLIVIQMSKIPHEVLLQHNEICGNQDDWANNCSDEDCYNDEDEDYDDDVEN